MADKVALITGTTGQDGAYLAELLLAKGYIVHGLKRCSSSLNTERVDHLYVDGHVENARFFLHYGDITKRQNTRREGTNLWSDRRGVSQNLAALRP